MENKKTKLTISGAPKKTFKNFESSKTQGKKTVIIDKKIKRPINRELLKNHQDLNKHPKISTKDHHLKLDLKYLLQQAILKEENLLSKEQLKD